MAFGVTVMVGPAVAGMLVALTGFGWTYTIDIILMMSMFLGLWTLPPLRPEGTIVRPGLASSSTAGVSCAGRATSGCSSCSTSRR
ncbi:hypothetical protein GCM10025863_12020 [Microbacterium suwonense]|uniref:Major facilitator superfamily (MFS) profile domain-containing protein n=1 Tax=Microbacterium suwonense TaxID=683047 RepID=A0ABM8FST8_9MICO|nr:hypothetical protein GCM10025863_12020 [Microbacterium suwonense]